MSKFKAGDRVKCTCGGGADCTVQGRVVGIDDDGSARVLCDNGEDVTWQTKHLALIAAATPVAVAPTLETATGAELDRIAADIGAGPRLHCESDASFRLSTVQYAAWKQRTADVVRALQPPDPCVTQAEWSAAIARINAQHKALDTVRRFLAGHSFASCSLACNRELREVMAVVLAALDAERAGK